MSTKTGVAFSRAMLPAVATNVKGGVMTSSPKSTPSAISASNNASEPDAQAIANLEPTKAAISASSCFTSGPIMNCWLSRTLSTAARISSFIMAYSALRSRNGKSNLGAPRSDNRGDPIVDSLAFTKFPAGKFEALVTISIVVVLRDRGRGSDCHVANTEHLTLERQPPVQRLPLRCRANHLAAAQTSKCHILAEKRSPMRFVALLMT